MQAQVADEQSLLWLYRRALALRASRPELHEPEMTWLDAPDGVLTFTRSGQFGCVINLSTEPIQLPDHGQVLLTSGPVFGTLLPPDTGAWLLITR